MGSSDQIRGGRAPSAEQQQGLSITFFEICTGRDDETTTSPLRLD